MHRLIALQRIGDEPEGVDDRGDGEVLARVTDREVAARARPRARWCAAVAAAFDPPAGIR